MPYLTRSRQEHQDTACLFTQCSLYLLGDLLTECPPLACKMCLQWPVLMCYRETASGTAQHRCITQQLCHGITVQRRRHHQQSQLFAQCRLAIETQGQPQVPHQAALVKFIEDHQADRVKRRIPLQHACKNALGHDLYACGRSHLVFQAHTISHRLTDPLPEQARHITRRGPGRQPARFQHNDFPVSQPRCIQQGQWYTRGLAGTGCCLQHGIAMLYECLPQFGQQLVNWQFLHADDEKSPPYYGEWIKEGRLYC